MAPPSLEPAVLWRSGAFRLALLQAAVFALVSLSLFGVTWWTVRQYVEQQIQTAARDELDELAVALDGASATELASRFDSFQHGSGEFVGLFDSQRRRLAGDFESMPEGQGDLRIRVVRSGVGAVRAVDARVVRAPFRGRYWLVAGVDRRDGDELLETVGHAFLIAGLLALIAALAGGFLTARRYLRRVEIIADAAGQIVDGKLDTRLSVGARADEIDRLSVALNAMWARIEALVSSMKQISSDVAHELRTPLSHLRFRLERTRDSVADPGVRAALDASLQDVDRVLGVFAALLRIAQIESRERRAGFKSLELSQLLEATVADLRPLFEDEERPLQVDIEPGIAIIGDATLMVQLVVNLLENVLRHTPRATPASIRLRRLGDDIELEIGDRGAGIPVEHRDRVLRPLVQLDLARSTAGAGLGLTLVKAITDLHGADLELSDAGPGLRVRLRFKQDQLTNR
ncbi:MAG: HAMP domain-containing sensor histidine kinase [Steroidobacteraceae bacterium]